MTNTYRCVRVQLLYHSTRNPTAYGTFALMAEVEYL